jgi:hypothetical protein
VLDTCQEQSKVVTLSHIPRPSNGSPPISPSASTAPFSSPVTTYSISSTPRSIQPSNALTSRDTPIDPAKDTTREPVGPIGAERRRAGGLPPFTPDVIDEVLARRKWEIDRDQKYPGPKAFVPVDYKLTHLRKSSTLS